MTFELPQLPYAFDALEPHISRKTIEFHYGKHHQAYVNKLNNLVPSTIFKKSPLEQIIREAEGGIFNNGAQIWNHSFYFMSFSPSGKREPYGRLGELITSTFGSFESFKAEFSKAALTLFGSGWVWLSKNRNGQLEIVQEINAGNPLRNGSIPLVTIDVWEHAYYLDYQNNRADYIESLWNLFDWEVIIHRFTD